MKTLYFDLFMGAAGDMLAAALFQLIDHPEEVLAHINALDFPGVEAKLVPTDKLGIQGLQYRVLIHGHGEADGDHSHGSHLRDIETLLGKSDLPQKVRQDAIAVYRLLADAESKVHGRPVEQIHFHEVGQLDAAVDIITVCLLMYLLKAEYICASPIHVGRGTVRCAHGILPVPAPATAELLRGIPCYSEDVYGELCTPTGAALLRYFVSDFGPMPEMCIEKLGYGMGQKDFYRANCLRVMLGEAVRISEIQPRLKKQ